jgi:uncharacterized repeat protein (TIGR03803 family)
LLQASDGNFYGTTRAGGTNSCRAPDNVPCGVLFKITPDGQETVLHSFGGPDASGYSPTAPLIQAKDGALYGTTSSGGANGGGTVFRITLQGAYSVVYSFGATATDGAVPTAGVIQASDGNFYGTTASGGSNHCIQIPQAGGNCGTVFKLTPSGAESVVYSFGASVSDGVEPNGGLIQASDGNFYGTTETGGAGTCGPSALQYNCGTVFRITPAGVETVMHSFSTFAGDGFAPQGTLIQATDGALYGTTPSGGNCNSSNGCGTVFKMTPTGQLTILYAFATNSALDGYGPSPFLIQATDGNFYGTTGSGGTSGGADLDGTVFKLTPSGIKTTLYSFGPLNTNPSNPLGGVIEGRDGAFYGVTNYSGSATPGGGMVFKLVTH